MLGLGPWGCIVDKLLLEATSKGVVLIIHLYRMFSIPYHINGALIENPLSEEHAVHY